jgi:hypothetical protein
VRSERREEEGRREVVNGIDYGGDTNPDGKAMQTRYEGRRGEEEEERRRGRREEEEGWGEGGRKEIGRGKLSGRRARGRKKEG